MIIIHWQNPIKRFRKCRKFPFCFRFRGSCLRIALCRNYLLRIRTFFVSSNTSVHQALGKWEMSRYRSSMRHLIAYSLLFESNMFTRASHILFYSFFLKGKCSGRLDRRLNVSLYKYLMPMFHFFERCFYRSTTLRAKHFEVKNVLYLITSNQLCSYLLTCEQVITQLLAKYCHPTGMSCSS